MNGRRDTTKPKAGVSGIRTRRIIHIERRTTSLLNGYFQRPAKGLALPTERRYTVPPKIMRVLAEMAIRHALNVNPGLKWLDVEQVLAWARRRAPSITLRRKARSTVDERAAAYQEYLDRLTSAWKGED